MKTKYGVFFCILAVLMLLTGLALAGGSSAPGYPDSVFTTHSVTLSALFEEGDWTDIETRTVTDTAPKSQSFGWTGQQVFYDKATKGKAGLPTVTGLTDGAEIAWDTMINLTIGGAENADRYDVLLQYSDGSETDKSAVIDEDEKGTGGRASFSTYDLEPSEYRIRVVVKGTEGYEDNELDIRFTLTGKGVCEEIYAELEKNTVARGDFLTVTIPEAKNAIWYDVRIRDIDWEEYYYVRLYGRGTCRLPLAQLETGRDYVVMVATGAPGYGWNESQEEKSPSFRVTDAADDTFRFEASSTQVETCATYVLSVYAPGADDITIFEKSPFIGRQQMGSQGEGDYRYAETSSNLVAEFVYTAEAHYPAADGQKERWVTSDPITVKVGSENTPSLDETGLDFTVPARILTGEDLTLSWKDIGQDSTFISVYREGEFLQVWNSWDEETNRMKALTIPYLTPSYRAHTEFSTEPGEPLFEAGNVYRVELHVSKAGYNGVVVSRQVLVASEEKSDVVLKLNGKTGEVQVPVFTDATVTIEGPEGTKAAQLWNGYEIQEILPDDQGQLTCVINSWVIDSTVIWAKCTSDDPWGEEVNWSGESNTITVNYTADGVSVAPKVSSIPEQINVGIEVPLTIENADEMVESFWMVHDLDLDMDIGEWRFGVSGTFSTRGLIIGNEYSLRVVNREPGKEQGLTELFFTAVGEGSMPAAEAAVPEKVARGTMLEVKIKNAKALSAYAGVTVSAAVCYDPESGQYGEWYEWDGKDTIRVNTAMLEARDEPYLLVVEDAAEGMQFGYAEYFFKVAVQEKAQMNFSATSVKVMESVEASAYVPGAHEIIAVINVEEDWEEDNVWNIMRQDDCWGEWSGRLFDRSGEYTVKLYAKTDSDDWTYTGVSTVLTCVADEVVDLSSLIPASVKSGEDLMAELPEWALICGLNVFDETAMEWVYEAYWDSDNGCDYKQINPETGEYSSEPIHTDEKPIKVPAEVLTENHFYSLYFNVAGEAIETIPDQYASFVVLGEQDQKLSLKVILADESRNPLINELFTMKASAKGAKAIRFWTGYDWWYETGEQAEIVTQIYEPGEYALYAQAYYGDAPWEADGFNWDTWNWNENELAWSGHSNIVELTFEKKGETGSFDFVDLSDMTVQMGEVPVFRFTEAENAEHYRVIILDQNMQFVEMSFDEVGANVYINTRDRLPKGKYIVIGQAGASGYSQVDSLNSIKLTVTDEVKVGTPTMITPASLTTIGEEAFTGLAAEVVQIADGVTSIGKKAFAGGKLKQVIIPGTVTEIGEGAFDSGTFLVGVYGSLAHLWAVENGVGFIQAAPVE